MKQCQHEFLPLGRGQAAPIVYEDSEVIVIDKPSGWMLAPRGWHRTSRNLQQVLETAIRNRTAWTMKRGLRFLRYVHRLDAGTSGLLLLAKSRLALARFTALFAQEQIRKLYVAIVRGRTPDTWECNLKLAVVRVPRPHACVNECTGKEARTLFRRAAAYQLSHEGIQSVVLALPLTGRMHQVRVHLAASGLPVIGEELYDQRNRQMKPTRAVGRAPALGLRALGLYYKDPFTNDPVRIIAGTDKFLRTFSAPEQTIAAVKDAVNKWPTTGLQMKPHTNPCVCAQHVHRENIHTTC